MTEQERAILEAFPGDDKLHRSARIALIQILHAGQWAELDLPMVAHWLNRCIEDPPWSVWFGPDEPLALARSLENIAKQLRRAASALNAAKPHWQKFKTSAEEPNVVGIREDREGNGTCS